MSDLPAGSSTIGVVEVSKSTQANERTLAALRHILWVTILAAAVLCTATSMLLVGRLRYMHQTFGVRLRSGLDALHKLGRDTRVGLEKLADTIRSWGDFPEELKEEMVALLLAEHESIAQPPCPEAAEKKAPGTVG